MYRLTVETLLGLQLKVDHLRIAPCIPAHWQSFKIHYRYRETCYHITIKRVGEGSGHVTRVTVDGAVINEAGANGAQQPHAVIPLVDDRQEHYVKVNLG